MDKMKILINAHALKSLINPIETPDISLAVGEDENHTDIPVLIFTEQHLPVAMPEVVPISHKSYEEVQRDGTGSSLALDDFETQNFNIGLPIKGV